MRRVLSGLLVLVSLCLPGVLLAADGCQAEAGWVPRTGERHFMVLAGRNGVFYDRSGPAFVMLIKATPEVADVGAMGIYADAERQPRFGAVPATTYDHFLQETDDAAEVS